MRIQDNFVSVVNDFFKFLIDQKKNAIFKENNETGHNFKSRSFNLFFNFYTCQTLK